MIGYKICFLNAIACIVIIFGVATAKAQLPFAGVPRTISYQGVLDQSNGSPVSDGTYSLTFRLYSYHIAIIGGHVYSITDTLWTETQSVAVSKGIFSVDLGSVTPLNLSFDQEYSLGITVGSGAELTPRIGLTSAPYSIHAMYADSATMISSASVPFSLSGLTSTGGILSAVNLGGGNGVVGESNSGYAVMGQNLGNASIFGILSTTSDGVYGASNVENGVYGTSSASNESGVFGTSVSGFGVEGSCKTTPGVYGIGSIGVEGQNVSDPNIYGEIGNDYFGIQGVNDKGTGVYGSTISSNTTDAGVWGVDNVGYGVEGYTSSGAAIYGDCTGSSGLAGKFKGNVYIIGDYSATGTKTAEVKLDNGSPVRLFCEEATGVYFTDYGESQLVNGKAHVMLDPTYLQTVTVDSQNPMMVFVQVKGPCHGVYVTNETSTAFDVVEQDNGTSDVVFDYRVVCKRKYFENERLATPEQDNAVNRAMMEKVWPEVTASQQQEAARVQVTEAQQKAMQRRMNAGQQR